MNLLIDIGNSRIKWCLHDRMNDIFDSSGVMFNDKSGLQDSFSEHWAHLTCPDRVLVANVAGRAVAENLDTWIKKAWQVEIEYVKTEASSYGVCNAYSDYSKLGVDRWMAIIAAWHRFHSDNEAICIIDCGTATTIDSVSESGQHLGGFIIPGHTMMQEMLMNNTSGISIARERNPSINFSNTTEQGVNNGCYLAMVASIDRIIASMKNDYGEHIKCIITGGNAELVLKQLTVEIEYEPDLVLHGLSVMSGKSK